MKQHWIAGILAIGILIPFTAVSAAAMTLPYVPFPEHEMPASSEKIIQEFQQDDSDAAMPIVPDAEELPNPYSEESLHSEAAAITSDKLKTEAAASQRATAGASRTNRTAAVTDTVTVIPKQTAQTAMETDSHNTTSTTKSGWTIAGILVSAVIVLSGGGLGGVWYFRSRSKKRLNTSK